MSVVSGAKKICFVTGPIGGSGSLERAHSDRLLSEIIVPALSAFPDLAIERSERISAPGFIDAKLIHFLLEASVVLADLSFAKPEVLYGIALRHMAQRPVIHMLHVGGAEVLDRELHRPILFDLQKSDFTQVREQLSTALDCTRANVREARNPVTRTLEVRKWAFDA